MPRITIALIAAALASLAAAEEADTAGESYLQTQGPIVLLDDVNREAEAWAVCAATYEIVGEVLRAGGEAASADELMNRANGSKLAIFASMITDSFEKLDTKNPSSAAIQGTLSYAKVAMQEWPKVARTSILADAERLKTLDQEGDLFMKNLQATLSACIENLEAQQMYIDLWREMVKSGMLKTQE